MRKTCETFLCVILCGFAYAQDVKQVFRPEGLSKRVYNTDYFDPMEEAAWISSPTEAMFVRFRQTFTAQAEPLTLDVSADERFILFLDGHEIARGPHRGSPRHWNYQTFELTLDPGEHTLEAIVMQKCGAVAQLSYKGGSFIARASGAYHHKLTTGLAQWQVAPLSCTTVQQDQNLPWATGGHSTSTGTSFYNEKPSASAFKKATIVQNGVTIGVTGIAKPGWRLYPTILPNQLHETKIPGMICRGKNVLQPHTCIPAHTHVKAYWNLGNYYCAYPEMETSGGAGAKISWKWAEALVNAKGKKDDRNGLDGYDFPSKNIHADDFLPDGRADAFWTTQWFRCGKWCLIEIETQEEPLLIKSTRLVESRYPTPHVASFECSDSTLTDVQRLCVRGMQMCMHETFVDCPFYEQQMYPGDSRVEFLTDAFLHTDDRLVRHAMTLFDEHRTDCGLIPMNFPTRAYQESTTYTLCYLLMVRDYFLNRANCAWFKKRLPGLVHTLLNLEQFENDEGLLCKLEGWSFMDWVGGHWGGTAWRNGIAPDGNSPRPSALTNLFYLLACQNARDIYRDLNEDGMARYWDGKVQRLSQALIVRFWDNARGLFADNVDHTYFSEHAQALAILSDLVPHDKQMRLMKALEEAPDLARTTVYFSFYLFDAYIKCGRSDLFLKRLDLWRDYVKLNLSTPLESPGKNPRSDCHAWGAHPLYHLHHGVLGVQSSAPFFKKVRIAPQPASLTWIRARTPHPQGYIESDLQFDGPHVRGSLVLPAALTGTMEWKGVSVPLQAGRNTIHL